MHNLAVQSKETEISGKTPSSGVDDPSLTAKGGSGVGRNLLLFYIFYKGFPIIHFKAIRAIIKDI